MSIRASTRRERIVSLEIASDMPGQQSRLDMQNHTERNRPGERRMSDRLVLTRLISGDHCATPGLRQDHGATRAALEVVRPDFLAIDQCQRDTICEKRSKLLHQVERERGPARPEGMKKPNLRIEPSGLPPNGKTSRLRRISAGNAAK